MTPRNKPLLPIGAAEASAASANMGGHRAATTATLGQLSSGVPQALTAMTGGPMQNGNAGALDLRAPQGGRERTVAFTDCDPKPAHRRAGS